MPVSDQEFDLMLEAVEQIKSENIYLRDRCTDLEQKSNEGGFSVSSPSRNNVGQSVVDSQQFKSLLEGNGDRARISLKTSIVNATGTAQPLVAGHRLDGIVHGAERRFFMRDLLRVGKTTSNLIEFPRETLFTNNAGPQVGGSPEQFENVTKPESGITFELATEPVTTLAHWIPVSKQVLSDSPALAAYINDRLIYGLKLKEDTQILHGTGSNGELSGLYTFKTAYTMTSPLSYSSKLDVLRDAMGQVELSDYTPNGIVLHSSDWKEIQLTTVGTSDARYVYGDPANSNEARLWGLPVVVTNSMTAGTFLVGAFDRAAQLWDRMDATVEVGLTDSQFVKNMISILAEERLALTIYQAGALVGGTFAVS